MEASKKPRERELIGNRKDYYSRTTIGELMVEGEFFGFTLEDTCRPWGVKLHGETAIPQNPEAGYKVGIRFSDKFQREVLVIYTEDDEITLKHGGISFQYVYFHGMNDHEDSLGCIGIAKNRSKNVIQGSLEKELFDKVSPWIKAGDDVRFYPVNLPQEK